MDIPKVLITHINPHLDDIAAIWLYKKFHPEFKNAQVEFISQTAEHKPKEKTQDRVYFGTGGGKYDEHKGDLGESAMSLVWKEIKEKELTPKGEIKLGALEELVDWNTLIDTGKAPVSEFGPFSVQAYVRTLDSTQESSKRALELGVEILDRIFNVLIRKHHGLKDWKERIEFKSKIGKAFAVSSNAIDRAFCKQQKGDLFIMYKPKDKSVQYFTPSHEIDLKPIYDKLKKEDPKADWYLHQSHHIILCGAGSAPEFIPSQLSLDQLINIAKSV